jgi:hypothetical protein
VHGVYGSEQLALFALILLGFLPGVIYYFDRTRYPYCGSCHKRIRKPVGATAVRPGSARVA